VGGIPCYCLLTSLKFTRQLTYCTQFTFWWHLTPTLYSAKCCDEQRGKVQPSMWHLNCWWLGTKYGWCNVATDYIFVFCATANAHLPYTALVGTEWFKSSGHLWKRGSVTSKLYFTMQSSIQEEKLFNFDCNEGKWKRAMERRIVDELALIPYTVELG